jgi:monoamine oxidase
MKRRNFIKKATALALLPQLISSCSKPSLPNPPDNPNQPPIIIIGAGAAGLYAAWKLFSQGYNVLILEASGQHGGRIRSLSNFADFDVELGAEEVHGNNSLWYDMVAASGANFVNDDNIDFYYLNNQLRNETQAENVNGVTAAWNFVNNATQYSGSSDKTVQEHLNTANIPTSAHFIVNAQVGNEYGTSDNILSIKGISEEDALWTAGNNNYALSDRTFLSVIEEHCESILPFIRYNKKVTEINYSAADTVEVMVSGGARFSCSRVIVTVPLQILKNNVIDFIPALPDWKVNAIDKIGMGAGMKIILKFSDRFWNPNPVSYTHLRAHETM